MIRSFRSEWLKLRRPTLLLGSLGGIAGFSVLGVLLGLRRIDREGGLTVATLSQHDGFTRLMSNASEFIGIVALGITAFAVASEYTNGTIRNLLVREPRRLRLLGGKALALASLVAMVVTVAFLVSFPVALAAAPGHGIATAPWTSSAGIGSLVAGIGDMILTALGFALIGAVLGLVFRSPAPAIVAGIAYVLPVEALLVGADSSLRSALFGQQLNAIAAGGTSQVAYGTALAVAAAWALAAAAGGAALFRQRDVVA